MVLNGWSSRTSGWQNLPLPTIDGQLSVPVDHRISSAVSGERREAGGEMCEKYERHQVREDGHFERLRCIVARRVTIEP